MPEPSLSGQTTPPTASVPVAFTDWSANEVVIGRLRTTAVQLLCVGSVVHFLVFGLMPVRQVSAMLLGGAIWGIGRAAVLPRRVQSISMVATLATLSLIQLFLVGYTPLFTISSAVAVVVSGLLVSRRVMGAFVVAFPAVFVGIGYCVAQGWLEFATFGRDPGDMRNWVRAALISLGCIYFLTSIVDGVAEHLTDMQSRIQRRLSEVESSREAMIAVRTTRLQIEHVLHYTQQAESVQRVGRAVAHNFQEWIGQIRLLLAGVGVRSSLAERKRVGVQVSASLEPSLELIDDLLILSRLSAPERSQRVLLQEVVQTTCRCQGVKEAGTATTLQTHLTAGLEVFERQDFVQQAVFNLLLNAIEATPSGVVQVCTTYAPPVNGRHTHALVVVEDTGAGIPTETLHLAIEPFFSTRPGQTGLGLSTVHSIAEQNGGWFELRSREGRGTRATLALKLQVPIFPEDALECAVELAEVSLHASDPLVGASDRFSLDPVPVEASENPPGLDAWRLGFARRVTKLMAFFTLGVMATHFLIAPAVHVSAYISGLGYVALLVWAGWSRSAPRAVVFGALIFGAFVTSLTTILTNTFDNPVVITGVTLAFCWSSLFGRRRTTWGMMALLLLSYLGAGWVYEQGGQHTLPDNMNMNHAVTWFRMAPQFFLLLLVLASTVVGVLDRLKNGTKQAVDALQSAEELRLQEAREGGHLLALKSRQALQDRMKTTSRLAGSLVHDLRNTLQLILSVSLLEEPELTPQEFHEVMDGVRTGLSDAAAITRRLREDNFESTGDCAFTEQVAIALRLSLKRHQDTIRHSVQLEAVGWVELSSTEVHRIVNNLVRNACEAMPDGGTLSCSVTASDEFAELVIADDGIGMIPEVAQRVFDPFFTTKVNTGTGLGLHAVHQILQSCGGHIALQSVLGQGTRFEVRIPRMSERHDAADASDRTFLSKTHSLPGLA